MWPCNSPLTKLRGKLAQPVYSYICSQTARDSGEQALKNEPPESPRALTIQLKSIRKMPESEDSEPKLPVCNVVMLIGIKRSRRFQPPQSHTLTMRDEPTEHWGALRHRLRT